MSTARMTVAQAIVRFLAEQRTERDGEEHTLIAGCFGIFGHGNLSGLGEALEGSTLRYLMARNEQAMVHAACGFARASSRLSTLACTSSVGPGATNMVTGAALATINRLPVLLLPGDTFASRAPHPVLQQLEDPGDGDVSVNDALRPVSRYWARIDRPEQLPDALISAARVLTDPAETGAVTIALPEDVQTEAHDFPAELFERRVWHVPRTQPEPGALNQAAQMLREAERPLIVAGGGVAHSDACAALAEFAAATGIPVAETQAGKGAIPATQDQALGAIGATGTLAANRIAHDADVVLGIGTRWTDFTTASRSLFQHEGVRFIGLNAGSYDAGKLAALPLVSDARAGIAALASELDGHRVSEQYAESIAAAREAWAERVRECTQPAASGVSQASALAVINDWAGPQTTVVCAAGSLPGDLHKLWRAGSCAEYHVEYGYSCMGYEIPGALGMKLAAPGREVVALVGDGSYLMHPSEIVTSIQEGEKLIIVLFDNAGFSSIGSLSHSLGADGFGTLYADRAGATDSDPGASLQVDLGANAQSLGAELIRARTLGELRDGLARAREADGTVCIHLEVERFTSVPSQEAWWDVPVAEVSERSSVAEARAEYEQARSQQRPYLRPAR